MENAGPINTQAKAKTGKEFANEVLLAEEDEEEEDEEEEDEYEFNETTEGETIEAHDRTESFNNSQNKLKGFRHENHNIILNLSKNTLRNILMLVCDEGVFLLFSVILLKFILFFF